MLRALHPHGFSIYDAVNTLFLLQTDRQTEHITFLMSTTISSNISITFSYPSDTLSSSTLKHPSTHPQTHRQTNGPSYLLGVHTCIFQHLHHILIPLEHPVFLILHPRGFNGPILLTQVHQLSHRHLTLVYKTTQTSFLFIPLEFF